MSERGVLFTPEAAGRIIAATQWQENWPQSRKPTRGVPAAPKEQVFLARITSGTPDANGLYAAVITQRQPDGSYVDFGSVRVASLNGETLTQGKRYAVQAVDPNYSGAPAYQTLGGAANMATAFSGAYYVQSGNQTITSSANLGTVTKILGFNSASYDTDGYGPGDGITIPFGGYYRVTLQVAWQNSNVGSRLCNALVAGTFTPAMDVRPAASGALEYTVQQLTFTYALSAGVSIVFNVSQDSGGNLDITPGGLGVPCSYWIERIG
jgi:hypothetical protein